jgi:hypothetical protein
MGHLLKLGDGFGRADVALLGSKRKHDEKHTGRSGEDAAIRV